MSQAAAPHARTEWVQYSWRARCLRLRPVRMTACPVRQGSSKSLAGGRLVAEVATAREEAACLKRCPRVAQVRSAERGLQTEARGSRGQARDLPQERAIMVPRAGGLSRTPGTARRRDLGQNRAAENDRACQEPCQARSCHRHTLAVRALGRQSHSCKKLAQTGQGNSMQGEPHTHL